jgi:hypothetical protein
VQLIDSHVDRLTPMVIARSTNANPKVTIHD